MSRYDEDAYHYDDHYNRPVDQAENSILRALLLPLCSGGRRVLDLGAGTGLVLDLTEMDPADYIAIDESEAMLDRLLEKHPNATIMQADLLDPDARSAVERFGPFDTVTSVFAANYFDLKPLFKTVHACLKPGGIGFIHGSGPGNVERHNYIHPDDYGLTRCRQYTPEKAIEAAEKARLGVVDVIGLNPFPDAYTDPMTKNEIINLLSGNLDLPPAVSYHFAVIVKKADD